MVFYLNWHSLSQLTAHKALSEGLDLIAVFTGLYELALYSEPLILFGGSYALWHGALWYAVGTSHHFSWDATQDVLCHSSEPMVAHFYANCMHGVGHGFLIRFTQKGYGKCSRLNDVGNLNITDAAQGDVACRSAPNVAMAQLCLHGFFHGVSESEFELVQTGRASDWRYPCDAFEQVPHYCYLWVGIWSSAQAMSEATRDEAGHEIKATYPNGRVRWPLLRAAGKITHWCFEPPALVESALLGCIYAVSGAFLPVFDRFTAVRDTSDPAFVAPSRADCNSTRFLSMAPYYGLYFPSLCELLFDQGPPIQISNTNLIDWCSAFVDHDAISSETQQRRWLACVHGSVGEPVFGSSYMDNDVLLYGEQYNIPAHRTSYCDQLLHVSWQPQSLRARAHSLCVRSPLILHDVTTSWRMDSELQEHHVIGDTGEVPPWL